MSCCALGRKRPPATKSTVTLLACGLVAGPFYLAVGLAQAHTRDGFDLTRHALSLLENGSLGWIQITNFLIAACLAVARALSALDCSYCGSARLGYVAGAIMLVGVAASFATVAAWVAVLAAWAWLALTTMRLRAHIGSTHRIDNR